MSALRSAGEEATDEGSALERLGIEVALVDGDPRLRKMTLPSDRTVIEALALAGTADAASAATSMPAAAAMLSARITAAGTNLRLGWGDDAHPVGEGGVLVLAGQTFPGSPALIGHSDGDVVLHAVADALLGAAHLGDLGRLFPADARTPAGISSGTLLAEALRRAAAAGVVPLWVDLTITAKAPRLAEHLDSMATAIAAALSLEVDQVSVKASTGNLIGDEGAGRAVRCQAILLAEHALDGVRLAGATEGER